jgi:ClpP class serine protease
MPSYMHVLTRLVNTPLLISSDKLEVLTSEISIKLLTNQEINRTSDTPAVKEINTERHKIAVIPVDGSLVNKNGAGSSGATSYERIKQSTMEAISQGIPNLVYDISSGGGEASGAFPLADFINSLPEKYGVSTAAFTGSHANSAAYALAAATQKIYATDTASVGSIGAVMSLVDVTKMDEKNGISYTILRSKEDKAAYNPHESMTDKVIEQATESLKVWDNKFNTSMVKYRPGLSLDTILALKGNTVNAVKGLELGLVDEIVSSIEDIFPSLQENTLNNSPSQPKIGNTMDLQEALSKLVEAQSQLESLTASSNLDVTKAVQNERARTLKILDAKKTFAASDESVVNAISKGWSLDTVTDVFTEVKAAKDALLTVGTAGTSLGSQTPEAIAALKASTTGTSFEEELMAGLKAANETSQLFVGVK